MKKPSDSVPKFGHNCEIICLHSQTQTIYLYESMRS